MVELYLPIERFCKMLGYTESELIGKSVAEVTYRDDLKKTMHLFSA